MTMSKSGKPASRKLGDCAHLELLPSGQCKGCGSLPGCAHDLRATGDGWLGCVREGCGYRRLVKAPRLVTVAVGRRSRGRTRRG